ncbi:MAG TPA: HlyD family efflux transporter periplasmic adaptor subunit [Polyangiaceae bacterium]|jgi:membrane fusion protein (multidrug efflux system)
MAYPFQRTLRSLNGHESTTRIALVFLGAMALCGLAAWTVLAKVPLLKVSTQGRIEPHNAVHRIEPPESGRVVQSLLELDKEVSEGDLLIEFDTREERLQLAQSEATSATLTHDLGVLSAQIDNKRAELGASGLVDEVSLREATAKDQELVPRRELAQQREQLAARSPTGALSDLEKLERHTEADELEHTSKTQHLGIVRLKREQVVRREELIAQLLQLQREKLKIDGQLGELNVGIDRLNYQIEKKHVCAAASGRLVDVVELAAGDYISQGTRLGTILAKGSHVRVRARFPKETVGIVRPGQKAQLKLDGYPWSIYGTVPAQVTSVGTEPGINPTPEAIPGTVRVELDFQSPSDPRIVLEHGLTATVEIEVGRVSPVGLLMRAIGEWNYTAPEPADPANRTPQVAQSEAR